MIQNATHKIAVIMKTHIWNDDIECFSKKIYHESFSNGVNFFILLHDENNNIFNKIDKNLKNIVLTFSEKDIQNIYSTGFYSLWLSNHWILMWFFQKYGHKYDYIWSMEYDVRISGDSNLLWNCNNDFDFLFVRGNYQNSKNKYNNHYIGNNLEENQKYHGYLQLARYSKKALEYLNECYKNGENGQDELITFSLLNKSGLSMSKDFLQKLVRGTWTWQDNYSSSNRKIYNYLKNKNILAIFHPIK
ncbi:hypothetical protein H012_gp674 [Acanthamoeba polyphaga moumouvirus]|uniref:Uncharacterized protein n=2 Tax=Moumouvirus TaxID=3080801 RepID=L7RC54_9VIRU|nr:hypothetical protein H012_gp674 [Acanthamoeba polyphaga moumouvirus]AEX63020.1 hypothetical protein mv_L818 [Moumouvirus Monve]AGC01791.1 hypothetical protein Moumou_00247 [Acanthamoeba polyphaga moumouvirus]AQN68140.1 hypothetical protein [Saudi moumouvirus]